MHDFIQFDESIILEEAIEAYEEATNTKLYAGDERRILLNSYMYIARVLASKANFLANQYFAKTAVLPYLQYIGEGRDVFLLPAEKSLVTMRFSLASIQLFDVEIPNGTRVTPNGIHFFSTKESWVITQGSLSVDIPSEATAAGSSHNDFVPGTILTLVDNIPFISAVTNIDSSSGGSEVEDIEAYRERIQLKPYNYNTTGAEDAYIYLAKSADSSVGSVSAITNADASVLITVLSKDGAIPNDLVIERVSAAVANTQKKRPLTDNVTVQKAIAVPYTISLSYTISPDNASIADTITAKVNKAVQEYKKYQSAALGRWINPDVLRNYVLNAGAFTVTLNSPSLIIVDKQSIAQLSGEAVVNYIGIYDGVGA
jgi:phage-related baseplate assembly protein